MCVCVCPVDLVRQLLKWKERLTGEKVSKLRAAVSLAKKPGRADRDTKVPHLWTPVHSLTNIIGHERGPAKATIPLRCCKEFEWILFAGAWKAGSPHDALWMMQKLIGDLVPGAEDLFRTRYTLQVILSATGGVLEQTFIYAMILLSKWLGRSVFPMGVFDWPPLGESGVSAIAAGSASKPAASSSSASGGASSSHAPATKSSASSSSAVHPAPSKKSQ